MAIMNTIKRYNIFSVIWVLALVFSVRPGFAETSQEQNTFKKGPITIRNQMPLYIFFLQIAPDMANVVEKDKFKINADYTVSNITVSAFTPATSLYDIAIDLEVSRVALDFRYGISERFELGLELPYISLSSGYLDNFVEGIEDGIGARTPRSRERQGSYEFDYTFIYNNKALIEKKHSVEGLGDIVFNAKYELFNEDAGGFLNISLRTALKFPTGNEDDLLGSGKFDYGFGLTADKDFSNKLLIFCGTNIMMIERPDFLSELDMEGHMLSGIVGLGYSFTNRFSFISQVSANSSPYPHSQTTVLDNDGYELGLGFNYRFKEMANGLWQFGFTENIVSASSPDVSLHTGLTWNF